MVKLNVKSKTEERKVPPDIFRAATENDPEELIDAINSGQSLNQTSVNSLDMTPIHLACVGKSVDFLDVALNLEYDPWIRDRNLRLSFDHAVAQGLNDVGARILEKLYPRDELGRPIMPF